MNLKDLDPATFKAQIDAEVKQRVYSFQMELERRAEEAKRGVDDLMAANREGALDLMKQIAHPEAIVFAATIPTPAGWLGGSGDSPVRLDIDHGYAYDLGRIQDFSKFFGARVVLTVLPKELGK